MPFNNENDLKDVMLKYNFAKKVLETELSILIDEYEFNYGYNPVEHIKYRIKTMESATKKLAKKNLELTVSNLVRYVNDMVGVRIVCSFISDVYKIVDIIKSSKQFIIKNESDYIKNPKNSGYTSYHINILVPIHLFDKTEYIEAEIQIRTVAMDCWASIDHKLRYKLPSDIPEQLEQEIENYAKENGLHFIDNHLPDGRSEKGKPTIINYFYHEQIRGSDNTGTRKV